MIILALDLGTTTGYCVGTKENHLSGIWNLKQDRFQGGGMRFVNFRKSLNDVGNAFDIGAVFFEEVRRHQGVDAAHVYGGLMATLTAWCEERKLPYSALPVGEIKRHWTGKGNAGKELMILNARERGYAPKDDNEADAIAAFHLGLMKL